MIREILRLGDERLYQVSQPVQQNELSSLAATVQDLHDTMMEYRRKYSAGRAIAAPQIAVPKRLIYLCINGVSTTFINPVLQPVGTEQMEVMDDCMSFPGLLVRVHRYRRCAVTWRDMGWQEHTVELADDLSELLQHEYDHLDGILATMRARDNQAFFMPRA